MTDITELRKAHNGKPAQSISALKGEISLSRKEKKITKAMR